MSGSKIKTRGGKSGREVINDVFSPVHSKYRLIHSSWPLVCECALGVGEFTFRYCFTNGCLV
jgi:hypothetical protein